MSYMKSLIATCLLVAGATASTSAIAQTAKDEKNKDRAEEQSLKDAAKVDAEEAKTRKQLEEARERLDKAAREVAELSGKLGAHARQEIRFFDGGPRRAVLGIRIDDDPDSQGVRVLGVSPGGPAADAGLRDRDIIIALDGETLPGTEAHRALLDKMRKVKPEQKVKVRVLRDGKKHDYVVVARPMVTEDRMFNVRVPPMGEAGAFGSMGTGPFMQHFRTFWPGEFEGLELASITPKLGAYFGVNDGVLVVSAPKDGAFKLEDGDVLQAIDGRKPDDGPHALRILRSYRSGEKLSLTVLRQRKPVTVAVTMPERPEMGDVMFEGPGPMSVPMPPMPGVPGAPPGPVIHEFRDGPATLE
ncbi:MAG TPA: PDZ domain-containing protein [Steroidobacteraceae bacterium]|nr:PDZ domain-containing protein [Steroidobacteraceae bacterium]